MMSFDEYFNKVADDVYKNAVSKGWYDSGDRNLGEAIALMHSELSEGLEALRNNNAPSDKLEGFLGIEEELADVIIRIMDISAWQGWKVGEAILEKIEYNKKRPVKHGKTF